MSKGSDLLTTVLGGAIAIGVLKTVDKMGKDKKSKKAEAKAKSKKKSNDPFSEWIG